VVAKLLAQAPVHKGSLRSLMGLAPNHLYVKERPYYCALSFKACDSVFRDNETFSSALYREMINYEVLGESILCKSGADHKRLRTAAQPIFVRPRAFGWWQKNWIIEIVGALTMQIEKLDKCDLNQSLCARLPIHTISRAFGVKGEDAVGVRFHLIRAALEFGATPQEKEESLRFVDDRIADAIVRGRKEPGDDVISQLLAAPLELQDGTTRLLSDEEVQSYARLILIAGSGTTWRQLGITLLALLTHRDQFEALKKDRKLLPQVLEESLRWNPTVPVHGRVTTRDVELEGVRIPEGSIVEGCNGYANRDPMRFENPDKFDIFRKPLTHLGFAVGPHLCLGRDVARSEMTVALEALMDRFPNIRIDPDMPAPQIVGGLEQRGVDMVPVVLR
jgi:cytochrome P450